MATKKKKKKKKGLRLKYQKTYPIVDFFSVLLRISYLKALLGNPDDLCRLQKVVVDVSKNDLVHWVGDGTAALRDNTLPQKSQRNAEQPFPAVFFFFFLKLYLFGCTGS